MSKSRVPSLAALALLTLAGAAVAQDEDSIDLNDLERMLSGGAQESAEASSSGDAGGESAPPAQVSSTPAEAHASSQGAAPAPYAEVIEVGSDDVPPQNVAPAPRRMLIDEIVVTAQRREENVRDVPMAISVLSGDDMRDAGMSEFNDLTKFVPNVSINTDWFTLYMRGVGTSEVNITAEQAVAYLLDDVYVSRVEFLRPGFLDIDRMEVLKGPQGTLFGRNSPAGAINITQGAPQFEWGSRFDGKVGELGTRDFESMVTGPISDDLAFRLAGSWRNTDPYVENLFDPSVPLGGKETRHVRGKLLLSASDDLELTLSAEYFDYDLGQWGIHEQVDTPLLWQTLFRVLDPNFEGVMDRRGTSRDGTSAVGEGLLSSLTADFSWAEHELSWVSGFARYEDVSGGDFDGTAFPLFEIEFQNEYAQATSELKISSPPGDIEYVGGLFAFWGDMTVNNVGTVLPNITGATLLQALSGPLANLVSPLVPLLGGITLFEGDKFSCDGCQLKTTSLAAFGQLSWHATDTLTFLAGGRYTWEDKSYEGHMHPNPGSLIWPLLLAGNGYDLLAERTYTNFSPKLSMTWAASEEATLYLTYADGFRSGSFNVVALDEDQVEFSPETSTTYEGGLKGSFFGGLARVNLGVFWTDYYDYQITSFETVTFASSNAEHVRVRGIEADVTASPFDGTIVVASLGYNDGEFVKYSNASCPTLAPGQPGRGSCALPQGLGNLPPDTSNDLSGQRLFRTPELTSSFTLIQTFPIPRWDAMVIASGSAAYRADEYIDSDLDPKDRQSSYWTYGARLGLRQLDGRWGFEVLGENLSDELVRLSSYDAPIASGAHVVTTNKPRSFSAKFSFQF